MVRMRKEMYKWDIEIEVTCVLLSGKITCCRHAEVRQTRVIEYFANRWQSNSLHTSLEKENARQTERDNPVIYVGGGRDISEGYKGNKLATWTNTPNGAFVPSQAVHCKLGEVKHAEMKATITRSGRNSKWRRITKSETARLVSSRLVIAEVLSFRRKTPSNAAPAITSKKQSRNKHQQSSADVPSIKQQVEEESLCRNRKSLTAPWEPKTCQLVSMKTPPSMCRSLPPLELLWNSRSNPDVKSRIDISEYRRLGRPPICAT